MNTLTLKSSYDDLNLAVAYKEPETEPAGIVQIVHGMCEHKERYNEFMEFLASKGFVCVIHDHRGHGASVKRPEDLGYMYAGGWKALVEDIEVVRKWSSEKWPGLKRTLLGHSMGSMAVRSYTKRYDNNIDKLIVCGSPSFNPAGGVAKFLANFFAKVKGDHYRPQLLQDLSFGSFNKPFRDEGFESAWVCSNRSVLEAYHQNPLCQFIFTANGFSNLIGLMKDCYSRKGWSMSNPKMPIMFISGADDPCRGNDKRHNRSVALMNKVGYVNITNIVYPEMRHEILNETDKQKVWTQVEKFVEGISA